MPDQSKLQQWWSGLTDDQRDVLRRGNAEFPMEPDATKLLIDSDCPVLPVGSTFDPTPGFTIPMPGEVAELINSD